MDYETGDELAEALHTVITLISRCEKARLKFYEGTAQHTLLKNRIKALAISKALITGECVADDYTKHELTEALRPIGSIVSKCEKAQLKHVEGTAHHTRFQYLINAMTISKSLIMDEIGLGD